MTTNTSCGGLRTECPQRAADTAANIMRDFDGSVAKDDVMADIVNPRMGEFPMSGFHPSLIEMVDKLSRWHPTPPDYWMASMLAATSAVAGSSVKTKLNKYDNTLSDWFFVVGDSGEGKSLPQLEILRPVYDISERMFDVSEAQNREERKGKPNNEYVHLPEKQLVTGRTTLASMEQLLDDNPSGILQHNDEALSAFEGRPMNDPFPLSRMIEFWNGATAPTNLVGRGRVKNKNPYHVWLAGAQPYDMGEIVNAKYYTRGMTPRILMFMPAKPASRDSSTTEAEKDTIMDWWTGKMEFLHRQDSPRVLDGTPEAHAFARAIEDAVHDRKHHVDRAQSAVLKKLPQHTHKLAGLVHLLNELCSGTATGKITLDEIRLAWSIAVYSAANHFELLAKYGIVVGNAMNKNRVVELILRTFPEAKATQISEISGISPNNIRQIKFRMSKENG